MHQVNSFLCLPLVVETEDYLFVLITMKIISALTLTLLLHVLQVAK